MTIKTKQDSKRYSFVRRQGSTKAKNNLSWIKIEIPGGHNLAQSAYSNFCKPTRRTKIFVYVKSSQISRGMRTKKKPTYKTENKFFCKWDIITSEEELIIIYINIIHLVMKTLTKCQCKSCIVVFIKHKIKVINLSVR